MQKYDSHSSALFCVCVCIRIKYVFAEVDTGALP